LLGTFPTCPEYQWKLSTVERDPWSAVLGDPESAQTQRSSEF
jgi:hypothetical protein